MCLHFLHKVHQYHKLFIQQVNLKQILTICYSSVAAAFLENYCGPGCEKRFEARLKEHSGID